MHDRVLNTCPSGNRPSRASMTCTNRGLWLASNSSSESFMQNPTSIPRLAVALAASILVAACGGDPGGPTPAEIASVSGTVKAASGAVVEGATVKAGSVTATTDAAGQ